MEVISCEDIDNEEEQSENIEVTGPESLDIKEESNQSYCLHLMLKYAWNGNFGAPVQDLLCSNSNVKVLDAVCGSGFWTLEMATEFPLARFYGVDSTPSFPDTVMPNNVEFIVADIITNGLPFKDAEFDYVFIRNMLIPSNFESFVTKELFRVVKPGGYLEFVGEEFPENHVKGVALTRLYVKGFKPWLKSQNVDYKTMYRFKDYLTSTNQLKNVTEEKIDIPIGKCNGFLGELSAEYTTGTIKSMADDLMPIMNLTLEEYHDFIKEIENEIENIDDNYVSYRRFFAVKNG